MNLVGALDGDSVVIQGMLLIAPEFPDFQEASSEEFGDDFLGP